MGQNMLLYNHRKEKERRNKMIWVTYEELIGNTWERNMEPCTTLQYENLKRRNDVVIITVERIRIV